MIVVGQLSLDLVRNWLVEHYKGGGFATGLNISGIATYQPYDGLAALKMVCILNCFVFY